MLKLKFNQVGELAIQESDSWDGMFHSYNSVGNTIVDGCLMLNRDADQIRISIINSNDEMLINASSAIYVDGVKVTKFIKRTEFRGYDLSKYEKIINHSMDELFQN